jgi:carbonic anhydrase
VPNLWDPGSVTPERALQRLIDGNRRFQDGDASIASRSWNKEMATQEQRPFAIILGCSDSRTPVEILFDQGFGDLFVVRIAGNIVAPSVVGSIEFAASQFGSRLVVVMGHTRCGAIAATVRSIQTKLDVDSKNIRAITERIAPNIEATIRPDDTRATMQAATRANVRASANHLRHGSRILEDLVFNGRLAVVGAEYVLETGAVDFFDGVPLQAST